MATNTDKLDLLKKDPIADANDTFNITTMLNDNWDKVDNYVLDGEYQTPVIVGTQIQLLRNSNVKKLYFKLNTDLTGGNITISLDAGATTKPLLDIEGNNITSLDAGFVEVIEDIANFTLRSRGFKLDEIILAIEAKGGTVEEPQKSQDVVNAINNDLFGTMDIIGTEKLTDLSLSSLYETAYSPVSSPVLFFADTDGYIVAYSSTLQKRSYTTNATIWTLSVSPPTDITKNSLGEYLICGSDYIRRISNNGVILNQYQIFSNGTTINAICVDELDNIYITYNGNSRKYNNSISLQWTATINMSSPRRIYNKNGYIYIIGGGTNRFVKLNQINGFIEWQITPITSGTPFALLFIDNLLYFFSDAYNRAYAYDTDGNLIITYITPDTGANIYGAVEMPNGDIFLSIIDVTNTRNIYYKVKRDLSSTYFTHIFNSFTSLYLLRIEVIPTQEKVIGYNQSSVTKYRIGYIIS